MILLGWNQAAKVDNFSDERLLESDCEKRTTTTTTEKEGEKILLVFLHQAWRRNILPVHCLLGILHTFYHPPFNVECDNRMGFQKSFWLFIGEFPSDQNNNKSQPTNTLTDSHRANTKDKERHPKQMRMTKGRLNLETEDFMPWLNSSGTYNGLVVHITSNALTMPHIYLLFAIEVKQNKEIAILSFDTPWKKRPVLPDSKALLLRPTQFNFRNSRQPHWAAHPLFPVPLPKTLVE